MITFDYNPKKEIVTVKYDGLITLEELLNYIKSLTEQTKNLQSIKILEDARNGNISPDVTDIDEILRHFQKQSSFREKVVIATVQDKPVETALNLLFQSSLDLKGHHYKVFSTPEAAIKWLDSF